MKERLLQLLKICPATAGRPDDFLDTLADDLQAVVIRAIVPGDPNDPVVAIEQTVEDIYLDHFGVMLSNLYMVEPFAGKRHVLFNARMHVVKAMIQAMLLAQNEIDESFDADFGSSEHGETIKRRLQELSSKPVTVN